ncbi:MAG: hypothetical protein KDD02_25020 [Phaeodactylibacter sp.]|nr:hypothetical protein [Phaeodactylibacter sp.]MCB9300320.1 hypothetical protein [Lewinellaceae bacterium]
MKAIIHLSVIFSFLLLPSCRPSGDDNPDAAPKDLLLFVKVAGTSQPAADVTVGLYEVETVSAPTYQEFYTLLEVLGKTDIKGYFRWPEPDPNFLKSQYALGLSGGGYYDGTFIRLPDEFPSSIHTQVFTEGLVRFHIQAVSPEPTEGVFHIFAPPADLYNYDIFSYSICRLDFTRPLDTTFVLPLKGHTDHSLTMAAFSQEAYSMYPPTSFWGESISVFCPARDTVLVEVEF